MGPSGIICHIFAVVCLLRWRSAVSALQDVTAELFGSEAWGTVAAFGDFNADKQTDIFLIRSNNQLIILLADVKAPYYKPKPKVVLQQSDLVITSVVPGDYDGDSQMDVLLALHSKDHSDNTSIVIFWGNNQTLDSKLFTSLKHSFLDEPLVLDFNGDMIPDIFGTIKGNPKPQICSLIGRLEVTPSLPTCNLSLRCSTALGLQWKAPISSSTWVHSAPATTELGVPLLSCASRSTDYN
ncbi:T-cell immunomodulatory protein-like [Rhincodon typus]|uniref:T-cell immunomodulatory protein-like n=1 Tax=Rhincodon typus TaxID=259920 RepID=UPI00202E344B|nr:T-cell immunomodulatory protein-like [Rhincodon typus]